MPRKRKIPRAKVQHWIGYCRKSTDDPNKQQMSIPDQVSRVKKYYGSMSDTDKKGRPLRIFTEEKSAFHPNDRPMFSEILRMADRGEVYGVIAIESNRISRNPEESGAFSQRIVDSRITFFDAALNGRRYTGDNSGDIFMLGVEGNMSWKDSKDKGDRIRYTMKERAAEGKHMGPVRIGYQHRHEIVKGKIVKRYLEVIPEIAPLIRRLFELVAVGTYSLRDLVKEAKKMGLRSRAGKVLGRTSIHGILTDPLYKGYIRFDGEISRGKHKAIVEEELWNRVQLVLNGRNKNTNRSKNLMLRELFLFGSVVKCPKCGRTLSPYRQKGKYIYYECKNPSTKCRVIITQEKAVEQLENKLAGLYLDAKELEKLRSLLLKEHERRSKSEIDCRRFIEADYEKVQKEIVDTFAQRKEAERMGILGEVDSRIASLRVRRDELQGQLNATHEKGNEWIEKVIGGFELIKLVGEALSFGSPHCREAVLNAVSSNYAVEGEKLVWEPRSPFRQKAVGAKNPRSKEWWSGLYDVRTEISETYDLLQGAFLLLQQAPCL